MSLISRVDSYINNMKLPWGNSERNLAAVSVVECYIKREGTDQFTFEKLWLKTFQSQVIIICWNEMSSLLAIG